MFIDTHAHLTDEKFDEDRESVIKKSADSTVEYIITSGSNLATSQQAVALALSNEKIYASVGVHPQDAQEFDENTLKMLQNLAKNKKVVAIGEIGLEYRDECPDRDLQKKVFLQQLILANQLQKPIVIHTRDAIGDTMQLLRTNKDLLRYGGTLHCFSESLEVANEAIKLGLYISVGGVSTFSNAKRLQEVIRQVPLESILLETDCPYLAPTPYRGKRNDPSFIPIIAQNLAMLKHVSVQEVASVTTNNARRLFNI